jgi:hypothetical protein
MTTLDNYLGIVRQEIVSHKVSIRQDAHVNYESLEHLMKDASRVIGEDKFVAYIVNPLMDLTPYVKTQFRTAVSIMKYFAHIDDESKKAFALRVCKILQEKKSLMEHNRIYDPEQMLMTSSLKSDLFSAYLEVRHDLKKPSRTEIKDLKGFLEGE